LKTILNISALTWIGPRPSRQTCTLWIPANWQ
jgi:hypothetical protein